MNVGVKERFTVTFEQSLKGVRAPLKGEQGEHSMQSRQHVPKQKSGHVVSKRHQEMGHHGISPLCRTR